MTKPPTLRFRLKGVEPEPHAAAPTLALRLGIEADGRPVQSVVLAAQVRIVVTRRPHDAATRERLRDLFGEPGAWHASAHSLLWAQATATVPAFEGSTEFRMLVPCTYDLDVAAAKYLHALDGGAIPVELLFSGTLFWTDEADALHAALVPWQSEAHGDVPVEVWREAMDRCFHGTAWLRLRTDTLRQLALFRARGAFATWDEAFASLLAEETGSLDVREA